MRTHSFGFFVGSVNQLSLQIALGLGFIVALGLVTVDYTLMLLYKYNASDTAGLYISLINITY
jgi:hypothetical protein